MELNKSFNFINFFRALAAFWVVVAHCSIWGNGAAIGLRIFDPKIAVDLFMMISGFLMMSNTVARESFEPLGSGRNYCRFILRRFFRLAPSYYLSLFVAVVSATYFINGYAYLYHQLQLSNPSGWPDGGVYDPRRTDYTVLNIILHLSFVFGLHPTYSLSTWLPDWSLSLEMQFYIVFPILYFFYKKFGAIKLGAWIGIPVFLLGIFVGRHIHWTEPSLLLFKLNYFLAGMLLFVILKRISEGFSTKSLIISMLFLVCFDVRYGKLLILLILLIGCMLFFGFFEIDSRNGFLRKIIENRLVVFASNSSYGVYLFHTFFISMWGNIVEKFSVFQVISPNYKMAIMMIFVLICAYTMASIVYYIVEQPGIRLGKHVINKFFPS